jgi:phosphate transport system substrate-binding protein
MRCLLCSVLLAAGLATVAGCGRSGDVIRVEGSDTMVNLAQAWAERYRAGHPDITVQVLGGGSGVGIASLIDGNCDLANSSRSIEPKEIQRVKAKRGAEPKEIIVGHDALAVYVHKSNPLDTISLDQLAEIYGEGGGISKWSQLGVDPKLLGGDEITRVSRQNSSGTYSYFREAVLGKGRDYKLGSIDQNGSKDVVALISHTPSAIGYSGMGYATPEVKMLKIAKHKGEPGTAPTVDNAKQKTYPITRSLLVYAVGQPQGQVKQFIDWILSTDGQKVVLELGYVPESEHK